MQHRRKRAARGLVDLREPLTQHNLNRGRVFWWNILPGICWGGPFGWDLARNYQGALTSFTGTSFWTPFSNPGGAGSLRFNGSSSYVITSSFGFGYGEMTLAAWVYISSTGTAGSTRITMFDCSNTNNTTGCPSFEVLYETTTTVALQAIIPGIFLVGPNTTSPSIGTPRAIQTWWRFAFVIDNAATTAYTYVNGKLNSSNNFGAQTFVSSSQQKDIGRRSNNAQYWPGFINDATLWNRPLSAAEIAQDFLLSQEGYPGLLRRRNNRTSFSLPPPAAGNFPPWPPRPPWTPYWGELAETG